MRREPAHGGVETARRAGPPRAPHPCGDTRVHPTTPILGIPVARCGLDEILSDAIASIEGRRPPAVVACANPHSLVLACDDEVFRSALTHATHLLPDGIGIVGASRLSREPIAQRIAGWDFFHGLLRALEARGSGRVFFLGSTPETLQKIAARLEREFPHLTLCGMLSPPFGEWPASVDDEIVAGIARAEPDLLWVGMTAPRQERWVERNRGRLAVPVIGSVGAVFDFYAGTTVRAPAWAQQAGLEWLHRLLRQPRRLWRRTFLSAPQFLELVLRERLGRALAPASGDEGRRRP